MIKLKLSKGKLERVITLVDLAGSEKWNDCLSKQAHLEAIAINQSLAAFSSVLKSLPSISQKQTQRIPFKDNLLTQVLENSLKGGSVVSFIITVRSEAEFVNESVRSLEFGWNTSQCIV